MREDKKEVTLFTFLNQILYKNRTVPYDRKIANGYILSQWISHDKELVHKVNDINKYQFTLPDKAIYDYYMSVIPTGRRYIKWVKKKEQDEKMKKRISKLQELDPKLSVREAKMILSFLKGCKEK